MLKKYKKDESHFVTRLIVFLVIIVFTLILPVLFVDSSSRSCLGPPQLLYFGFIGFPIMLLLYSLDILILLFLKAFKWEKLVINFGFVLSGFLLLFLLAQ